uniref:Spermatogenesis associated 7 n=1 Tax=Pelusios castaneus TaxID=367368 RepID=A0A8C8SGC0_9SAUR
ILRGLKIFMEGSFCIDSSRRLNNQYLIRDHLAVHYNKILSAKVADQQRREKLKKEIARCEKEMSSAKNVSRSSSRGSGSPFEAEDNDQLSPRAQNTQKLLSRSLLSSDRQGLDLPNPAKYARKDTRKTSNASISNSSVSTSSPQRKLSGISYSSSAESVMNISYSNKHQDAESKVYSGDLLDKHSNQFTDSHQPFTPRTLKSDAKSFLSQYRYYTPAKRKRKNPCKQQVEAETQTDLSSVGPIIKMMDAFQHSLPRYMIYSRKYFTHSLLEEELLYLRFIEDVTDEILKLGLFSNRLDMFLFPWLFTLLHFILSLHSVLFVPSVSLISSFLFLLPYFPSFLSFPHFPHSSPTSFFPTIQTPFTHIFHPSTTLPLFPHFKSSGTEGCCPYQTWH